MSSIKDVMFCVRTKDSLAADSEYTVQLYGDDSQFFNMLELCRWLTFLSPQWIVEYLHYEYSSEGTVGEIYFDGKEIDIDENGNYYKIEEDCIYILKDTENGLDWEYAGPYND